MAMVCFYSVLEGVLGMRVAGSVGLFVAATALYLFFAASLGIFLATLAGTMAQFALLFILVQMPMYLLSGGLTPLEGMPQWLPYAVQLLQTKHYGALTQAHLSPGAGLRTLRPEIQNRTT